MAIWGYWRTSTTEQDSERQQKSLKEAGCDRIYGDQTTGTSAYGDRPELSKCMDGLRNGDTLVIHELDRLGRSMVEMLVQVNGLIERGVAIKTLDGRLDTATMPEELVKLVVGVMGYAAEMELKGIKKRTAEGREVAKNRGVKFGRKRGIAAVVPSVVGAVAVFDGPSVAMLVAPVVGLLFFVFAGVVVMVVMSTMGFRGRTQADTGDDHHERSDAKTLNKRHGASMD